MIWPDKHHKYFNIEIGKSLLIADFFIVSLAMKFYGLEAGLYYNVQGTTLEFVGAADRPDIYTKPFHSLNFNSNIKIGQAKRMLLGIKIENILNSSKELVHKSHKAADQVFMSRKPGEKHTLKLSFTFK